MNAQINNLFIVCLFLTVSTCVGCKNKGEQNVRVERQDAETVINVKDNAYKNQNSQDSLVFKLSEQGKAVVREKELKLFNPAGQLLAINKSLIRIPDENKVCFSEGFKTIVSKGNFFTIEQQNCSNKYLIDEYITFKYNSDTNDYVLHKLGFVYRNRANPDIEEKEKIFTKTDFGDIRFREFNLDSVYIKYVNR